MQVKNPIPKNNVFATPVLADIQRFIETLPAKEQANANLVFMFTLNSCNALAQAELERMADMLVRV